MSRTFNFISFDEKRIPELVKEEITKIKGMKVNSERYSTYEIQEVCFDNLKGYIKYALVFNQITNDDYEWLLVHILEALDECLEKK